MDRLIGNKRNAFGMVLGHVGLHKGEKLEQLLTEYFAEALREAGYNVAIDGTSPEDSKYHAVIEGNIEEFWFDFYMQGWHKVGVNIKLPNPDDQSILWEKLIKGSASRTLSWATASEFERITMEATTIALNHAATEFASDEFYNTHVK